MGRRGSASWSLHPGRGDDEGKEGVTAYETEYLENQARGFQRIDLFFAISGLNRFGDFRAIGNLDGKVHESDSKESKSAEDDEGVIERWMASEEHGHLWG